MLKVVCIAAILAVAAPWPQGGLSDISYQFPYSSQSIKLHTDDDEDYDHKHQEFEEHHHHHEVYHPIQDKQEIDEEHSIDPPKIHEETMEMPIMDHKKPIEMPIMHHKKPIEMPKKQHEKHLEFPKMLHEKLPMSMMMMYNEMPNYEEKKMHHKLPKKYEEYSNKDEYHAKHNGNHEEKHEAKQEEKQDEKHEKHHHEEHNHPKYQYDYTVEDPHTGDYKTHHESRHGDLVHGFYTIHEADGTTRIVEYSADKHDGFKATVRHEGHPTHVA